MMKLRRSFSFKIILVVLAGILVPLLTTIALSIRNYSQTFTASVNTISQQQVSNLTSYVENTLVSAQDSISLWLINHNIQSFVRGNDSGAAEEMTSYLRELCNISGNYRNAYLFVPAREALYRAYNESVNIGYAEVAESPMLSEIQAVWQLHTFVYPYASSDESLAVVVPIRSSGQGKFLGYCMLKLSAKYLSDAFDFMNSSFGTLFIADSAGQVVHSSDGTGDLPVDFSPALADGEIHRENGCYICCSHIENSKFYVISATSANIWGLGASEPFFIGTFLSLLIVLLSLGATLLIIRGLLNPIHDLAHAMETNDPQNLKPVPLDGKKTGEIAVLEVTYNDMVNRINTMIEQQFRSELLLRDTRLRALQLQINPHFVNNTLQMISDIAIEEDMLEIYDLLQAFSRMFYYSLRFKDDTVELSDELAYLEHYILIQRHRFPSKFIMNFEIDEQTRPLPIPKMTLQPILENTFQHALSGVTRTVSVTVMSVLRGDHYEIIIEDDGCGMTPGALSELREKLAANNFDSTTSASRTSIGLTNVNARIRLLYGEPYGIRLDSEPRGGTTVVIALPCDGKAAGAISDKEKR